jgi:hypothetical protein
MGVDATAAIRELKRAIEWSKPVQEAAVAATDALSKSEPTTTRAVRTASV